MKHIEHSFNDYQTQELEKLFEKFSDLAKQVILTAKTTKMALELQLYKEEHLSSCELELAFENILENMKFIYGESLELSCIPDYLFWEKRNSYDQKTIS